MPTTRARRVLVTGATGDIGGMLVSRLVAYGWSVTAFDIIAPETATPGVQTVVADIHDRAALDAAMGGVDAVVHLAGIPGEARFDELLHVNVLGTYAVYEAMRRAGVDRMVFASTNHVSGFTTDDGLVTPESPSRPDSYYGISKVSGEALGRFYADEYGFQVRCVRIGSCVERPRTLRHLATWLSPGDLAPTRRGVPG